MMGRAYRIFLCCVGIGYLLFLLGLLLLGRAFSLLSLGQLKGLPIYITEVLMVISWIFLLWSYLRRDFDLSLWLKSGYFLFCLLSFSYLFFALIFGKAIALREIVLNGYMVFGYTVFVLLKNFRFSSRVLFMIFILVSLLLIIAYRNYLINSSFLVCGIINSSKMKIFNIMLYCGLFFASCLGLVCSLESRFLRGITLLLAVCFGVLILASDNRTTFFALSGLLLFFLFFYPYKLKKKIIILLIILVGMSGGIFCDRQLFRAKNATMRASLESLILSVKMPRLVWREKKLLPAQDKKQRLNVPSRLNAPSSVSQEVEKSEETLSHSYSQVALRNTELAQLYLDKGFRDKVGEKLSNLSWRFDVWRIFLRLGRSSPLLGVGFGVYPDLSSLGLAKPNGFAEESGIVPPHNELIDIFYKMGLLGLLIYLYVQGYFLWGLKEAQNNFPQSFKALPAVLTGCLVYWHIMALSFDLINSPPTNVILWILLGVSGWCMQYYNTKA